MNSTTTTPRTIDADVFHRARRAGAPLNLAAYVARPPVLNLTWEWDRLADDGNGADVARFEIDGRTFLATGAAPAGGCESCAELVDAYQRRDEGVAWITPSDFDRMDHRVLTVETVDSDGETTGNGASLYGVCGFRGTEIERLSDDRYIAETVAELAHEAATDARNAEITAAERARQEREQRDAERRRILHALSGVAVAHGASPDDEMIDGFRRELGWSDDDQPPATRPVYVVTFDTRTIDGPGAVSGLRRMTIDEARGLRDFAAATHTGRIVNVETLVIVE